MRAIGLRSHTPSLPGRRQQDSGRISGRALEPGGYQAVFTAIDAAGPSLPRSLSFTH